MMGLLSFKGWLVVGVGAALAITLGLHLAGDAKVRHELKVTREGAAVAANARDQWIAYGRAEKAAYDAQARLRGQEDAQAVATVSSASKACDARVTEARRSASSITALLAKEPAHEPTCAADDMLDPRELRDSLQGHGAPGR